jgi:hypothetical protein
MKKAYIMEKKATLDIIENLFDRMEYMAREDEGTLKTYREELDSIEDPEIRKTSWRNEEIEKLNARMNAYETIQKALEKLI